MGKDKFNSNRRPYKFAFECKREEKFDIDDWLRQHQNIEYPKRGKKNSLGEYKKNKRRH